MRCSVMLGSRCCYEVLLPSDISHGDLRQLPGHVPSSTLALKLHAVSSGSSTTPPGMEVLHAMTDGRRRDSSNQCLGRRACIDEACRSTGSCHMVTVVWSRS